MSPQLEQQIEARVCISKSSKNIFVHLNSSTTNIILVQIKHLLQTIAERMKTKTSMDNHADQEVSLPTWTKMLGKNLKLSVKEVWHDHCFNVCPNWSDKWLGFHPPQGGMLCSYDI